MRRLGLYFVALGLLAAPLPAAAQAQTFGPFVVPDGRPELIMLNGPIAIGDAVLFWNAIARLPGVTTLVLASPGGSAADALAIGELAHGAGLNTWIVPGTECAGACALIYLAGIGRAAEGALTLAPLAEADVAPRFTLPDLAALEAERLAAWGAPAALLDLRAALAPGETRTLTAEEVAALGLDRSRTLGAAARAAEPVPLPPPVADITAPFTPYDDIVLPAIYQAIDPDGFLTEQREAFGTWSLGGQPDNPIVRLEIVTLNPSLLVTVHFIRHSYADTPYVGALATVSFAGDAIPPAGGIVALTGIVGDQPLGGPIFLSFALDRTATPLTFTLQFLDLFKDLDTAFLAGADRLLLAYQNAADPGGGMISVEVGETGRAVFARAMEIWGGG